MTAECTERIDRDGHRFASRKSFVFCLAGGRAAATFLTMKNPIRCFLCCLLGATSVASAATPTMDVTVSNAAGKVAYKGRTNAGGTFATGKLGPGTYVVQLNSKGNVGPKGSTFAVVVSAGKRKVSAESVAGEKFGAGGVALKVDVGAGLNITGQVAPVGSDQKPGMVWIPQQLGSNIPGHWAPAGSAEAVEAKTRTKMSREDVQRLTERSYNPQG